jgi:hypothetical protein
MEETTTSHASIFTLTSMPRTELTTLTETTKSGQLWPSSVSLTLVNSLLTEQSLSIATRSGIFNQCQFHTHPRTQTQEQDRLLIYNKFNHDSNKSIYLIKNQNKLEVINFILIIFKY